MFFPTIYFDLVPDMNHSAVTLGKTTYSSADIVFLSGTNYLNFLTIVIYNSFHRPETFCILRSNMKTVKVQQSDARTLTTVHKRLSQISRSPQSSPKK